MNVDKYISSGVLENYCLGLCDAAENAMIEKYALTYPAVKNEIEKIRNSLEDYFQSNQVKPSSAVKTNIMLSVYRQAVLEDKAFAPLIGKQTDVSVLASWLADKRIDEPAENFDNLFITELPSTEHVINFIVQAKAGHETEMHEDFIEYLYIVRGSCIMNFEGEERAYKAGDIIQVDPHINHTAIVTSEQPMIAFVQRQACA